MLEGGEDPRFIARRMVMLASEDIGNADPRALEVAVAAAHAVEHVGMPECALNLAQAAVYLALAPKSNASYKALGRARDWVREHGTPLTAGRTAERRRTPARRSSAAARATTTRTTTREGVSEQELMPDEAIGERFLELSEHGEERELRERFERIRQIARASLTRPGINYPSTAVFSAFSAAVICWPLFTELLRGCLSLRGVTATLPPSPRAQVVHPGVQRRQQLVELLLGVLERVQVGDLAASRVGGVGDWSSS